MAKTTKVSDLRREEFVIIYYKKVNEVPGKKIKQLGPSLSYLDRDLKVSGKLTYGIKVVTPDGKSGSIATSSEINYIKK